MAISREAIYAALMARMQAKVPGIVTFSRKLVDYDQVDATQQPALLVIEGDQNGMASSPSLPMKWTLGAHLILYVRTAESATPATPLLNVLDAIEAALERQPGEGNAFSADDQRYTTLGGLVRHARIAGAVQVQPGAEGEQGIAIVPIEMLVTA